jgi:hypothetical protein
MKDKNLEEQIVLPEGEEDRKTQKEIKDSVKKWGRVSCYLGLASIMSAAAWFLFFPGQAFHHCGRRGDVHLR